MGSPRAIEQALAIAVKDARATDPLAPITVLLGNTLLRPYLQRRLAKVTGGIVNARVEAARSVQPRPPVSQPDLSEHGRHAYRRVHFERGLRP